MDIKELVSPEKRELAKSANFCRLARCLRRSMRLYDGFQRKKSSIERVGLR
jgi:hypothetical protein